MTEVRGTRVAAHPWAVWYDTAGEKPCYQLYYAETGEVMETRGMPTNATEALQLYPRRDSPGRGLYQAQDGSVWSSERAAIEAHYGIKPGA